MSIRKYSVAFFCMSSLIIQSVQPISLDNFLNQTKQTAQGIAVVAGLTVGTYLAGRTSSALHYSFAYERFNYQINLLKHKWLVGSEAELCKQLKETILKDHENKYLNSWFCEKNRYRNYPLLRFKDDLDFYIPRLWILQIFHLGTEKHANIQELIGYLKELRNWIVSDYEFVKERRRYEEKSPTASGSNNEPVSVLPEIKITFGSR